MTVQRFDLIFVDQSGERTLSAGVIFDNGRDVLLGPYPAKEGLAQVRDALVQLDPITFADANELELSLIAEHFGNLYSGHNRAGQSYPIRIGST